MVNWADLEFGGPQPPQDNIDKWERAVNEGDASILTTEDRLKILRRWPLQDANFFCNFYVGLSIDELIQKAAGTDDLTEAEAIIILYTPFGDCTPEDQREMTNQSRWSQNTKKKFHAALDLILAEMDTERRARANAEVAFERVKAIRRAELQNFSKDDLRNITGCNKLPWVKALEKHLEQQPAWGFVFFRSFRDENKIEPGLRYDAFLYANSEAIDSVTSSPVLPSPAFIMAAEAAYDGRHMNRPLRDHGYAGSVRIAIPHVYTTFWARLISAEEDQQQRTSASSIRHTWGDVFAKSQIPHEKTYPIKPFFMGFALK
ncbi:hypothetical protein PENSUB_5679 [Penicillium subrubescens]|uniref:Uncharacterized protein n=1 Tax=Penicillium subrubescens TaxID=1316194 RepID=A0A1Q5U751_9EURO|nr:hypothetical protein PENSUB_5679 [Penicillium subrubescens]